MAERNKPIPKDSAADPQRSAPIKPEAVDVVKPPTPPLGWMPRDEPAYDWAAIMRRRAAVLNLGFETNPPPPLVTEPAPEARQVTASSMGMAQSSETLTITPSPELQAAFDEMQARVKVLEDFIGRISAPQGREGIGGNFPPEPIAEELSNEWAELRQLIAVLKTQATVPQGKPTEAIEAQSRLSYLATLGSFIGRRIEDFSSEFAKKLGADAASVVKWALVYQFMVHSFATDLRHASEAVEAWLRLLGY